MRRKQLWLRLSALDLWKNEHCRLQLGPGSSASDRARSDPFRIGDSRCENQREPFDAADQEAFQKRCPAYFTPRQKAGSAHPLNE
jgi:hypothetical protein